MRKFRKIGFILLWFSLLTGCTTPTAFSQRPEVKNFIHRLVVNHHFNQARLTHWFDQVKVRPIVIHHTNHPKETAVTWSHYRQIFLTPSRIHQGANFWHNHQTTFTQDEQTYGVPPQIIAAIIGVETAYGRNLGKFKVMDSLSTLAFIYPARQAFFQHELSQYLLLTRDLHLNPLDLYGSYAGAVGLPQFMPSNYRTLAISAQSNRWPDLWHQPNDAILSVANFFHHHGWQSGQFIAMPARAIHHHRFAGQYTIQQLQREGLQPAQPLPAKLTVDVVTLTTDRGKQYWLVGHNFKVIMDYNHSLFYAMAVYQLSVAIEQAYQ